MVSLEHSLSLILLFGTKQLANISCPEACMGQSSTALLGKAGFSFLLRINEMGGEAPWLSGTLGPTYPLIM